MRERDIERYLVARIKAHGGLCLKFTCPQRKNVPDRVILMHGRPVCFAECKATGEYPTSAQRREHQRFRSRGVSVWVVDSVESVNFLMSKLL